VILCLCLATPYLALFSFILDTHVNTHMMDDRVIEIEVLDMRHFRLYFSLQVKRQSLRNDEAEMRNGMLVTHDMHRLEVSYVMMLMANKKGRVPPVLE